MINNFFSSVEQVADKIVNNYYINTTEQKCKSTVVDVETEDVLEEALVVTNDEHIDNPSAQDIPESVKECFRFPSEFVRLQVEAIVKEFYLNKTVNLALIEIALYDHGQLHKRSSHTIFVSALIDWGILSNDIDIAKTANGMSRKFGNLSTEGYKNWDKHQINERTICINIGNKLADSMKYNR